MIPAAPVPHVCRPHRARSWLEQLAERLIAPVAALGLLMLAVASWFATRLYAVGVVVETASSPAPSDSVTSPGATYFVAGITERGDTTAPVELKGMSDYTEKLGARVSYGALYDDLSLYFAYNGTRAFVARVVGDDADAGTLTLVDRAVAPVNTLRIDATSEGSWSARVKVAVEDGQVADSFTVIVLFDNVPVETFYNLASPLDAESALTVSRYVRATALGSATAAPNDNPAVLAATALSAGDDDRGTLVAADYVTALGRFTADLGPGAVAIPGQSSANVGAGIKAHAAARRRIALLATASGQTDAQAKAATVTLMGDDEAASGVGIFWPWVAISDGAGGSRLISPEGYVAGVRARAHKRHGPWRAPAGDLSRGLEVIGVETQITTAQRDDLVAHQVNPIMVVSKRVELYGWRSLSTDARNFRQLTGRDVMNEVAALGAAKLERYVFGTVDGRHHFENELGGEMNSILEPMLNAGGLYERVEDGNVISPAYRVDPLSANTVEVLAEDQVIVDVFLRVSPVGELIRLRITKVSFDSPL